MYRVNLHIEYISNDGDNMITDLQVYTLHDALPTFLDINGQPVIGRLKFYEPDGTTYKAIYADSTYTTELPNPLLTNLAGRPGAQPFLKNGLYRVVVEKFIGEDYADMGQYQYEELDPEHLSDIIHWEFEKEFLIDSGKIDAEQTQLSYIATVETIAELRQLSIDEYKYATVINYDNNVKGIKPRTYVWNSVSTRPEDYGSTIISSNSDSGRWELLESATLDATTFGISPYVDSGILQSRLNGLANYSMANYRKAQVIYWTPGVYALDNGSNFSIGIPVVCYGNLKFMCPNGTARVAFQGGLDYPRTNNLNDVNTTLVINQDTVHSAWWAGETINFNGLNTLFNTVIVDNATANSQGYSNLNLYLESPNKSIVANNCTIRLNKNINSTNNVFYNCRFDQGVGQFTSAQQTINGSTTIHPWMFTPGLSVQGMTIGRNIQYSCAEWGAQRYCELKLIQGDHHIGNINEEEINISLDVASEDINDWYVIENGSGTIDLNNLGINIELHNFSGTLLHVADPTNLNLIDCWITLDGNPIASSIALRRGSIAAASTRVVSALYLEDVDVNTSFNTMGIVPQYIRCNINQTQFNYLDAEYRNCTISNNTYIEMYPGLYTETVGETSYTGQYMNGRFIGNIFNGNSAIKLKPRPGTDYSTSLVGILGKYVNNISDHAFIDDTAWAGITMQSKSYRRLVYDGNVGGCPVKRKVVERTPNYTYLRADSNTSYLTIPDGIRGNTGLYLVADWRTPQGSHNIAGGMYWVFNIDSLGVNVSDLFFLPNFVGIKATRITNAVVQGFLRTDSDGFYTNTFDILSPLINSSVSGDVATLGTFQPIKFEWTGMRYNDNDNIDGWRSSLWMTAYNNREDGTRFNAEFRFEIESSYFV